MKKNKAYVKWALKFTGIAGILFLLIFLSYFIKFSKSKSDADCFVKETDFPFYLDCQPSIAIGENGYYYLDPQMHFLNYYDISQQTSYYVCTLPACSHNSPTCNAYFDSSIFDGFNSYIWIYENRIYMLGNTKETNSLSIFSLNLDGSDRRKEFDICEYSRGNYLGLAVAIHRGYIYYAISFLDPNNSSVTLYRKSLYKDQSKSERIFEFSGKGVEIFRIKGFGSRIFFQCFSPDQKNEEKIGIYALKVDGSTIIESPKLIKPGAIREYTVVNSSLYYCTDSGVNVNNMETGLEETFYDVGNVPSISFDGIYFYVDNRPGLILNQKGFQNRTIEILDTSGRKIDSIDLKNGIGPCLFGDENFLFSFCSENPDNPTGEIWLAAFDKGQVGSQTHNWIRF